MSDLGYVGAMLLPPNATEAQRYFVGGFNTGCEYEDKDDCPFPGLSCALPEWIKGLRAYYRAVISNMKAQQEIDLTKIRDMDPKERMEKDEEVVGLLREIERLKRELKAAEESKEWLGKKQSETCDLLVLVCEDRDKIIDDLYASNEIELSIGGIVFQRGEEPFASSKAGPLLPQIACREYAGKHGVPPPPPPKT